eukprot:366435-Chlamydomonas_euryale.AAC.1
MPARRCGQRAAHRASGLGVGQGRGRVEGRRSRRTLTGGWWMGGAKVFPEGHHSLSTHTDTPHPLNTQAYRNPPTQKRTASPQHTSVPQPPNTQAYRIASTHKRTATPQHTSALQPPHAHVPQARLVMACTPQRQIDSEKGQIRWAREGCAREGCAREGCAREGCAREGYAREGCAREGCAREGYAREGCAREGCAREGCAREGSWGEQANLVRKSVSFVSAHKR